MKSLLLIALLALPLAAQNSLTSTTLTTALGLNSQTVTVGSTTGITVSPQTILYVHAEAMRVVAVSGNVLTVTRGELGTPAGAHAAGSVVLIGRPDWFAPSDPQGTCSTAPTTPWINIKTRTRWSCAGGVWLVDGAEINVKRDFGAVGDGVTDDTAAIQQAITAACTAGGSRVFIPPGSYLVNGAGIVFTTNTCTGVEVYGAGDSTRFPVALARTFTSPSVSNMAGAGLFQGVGVQSIHIHDLFVDGANVSVDGTDPTSGTQRAVSFGSSTTVEVQDILIQRLHIDGLQSETIYVQGGSGSKPTRIRFKDNHVTYSRFSAMQFNSIAQGGNPPTEGILNEISGNVVEHAGAYCIEGPAAYTAIRDNRLYDCRVHGISDTSNGTYTNNNVIEGNILIGLNDVASNGIYIAGRGIKVVGNDISGFGNAGIFNTQATGTQGQDITIMGNTLHNNGSLNATFVAEMTISSGTSVSVIGNNFYSEGSTDTGLRVITGTDLLVSSNRFTGYATGNISDPSTKALIWNNDGGVNINVARNMWTNQKFFFTPTTTTTIPTTTYAGLAHGVGAGSQIRLVNSDADGGLYFTGVNTSQGYIFAGTYFSGSAHFAKGTTSSGVALIDGVVNFFSNTGLTPGNTYAPTEVARMNPSGGIKLTSFAQPSCNSAIKGTFFYTSGGAGVKDSVVVCAKDAADAYAWRTIY